MKGECYALVWGIMHFWQYLYRNHFTFHTNHKPLEWLVTLSHAYERRGRWIITIQHFSFKIVHKVGSKHTNVDAISQNPMDITNEQEDLTEKIEDFNLMRPSCSPKETFQT